MDLTCYTEEMYAVSIKGLPPELDVEVPVKIMPRPLTEEANKAFFDFDRVKVLEGIFNGPGPEFYIKDPSQLIRTWSFTGLDNKIWLVPQWLDLEAELSKAPPDEFIYHIEYKNRYASPKGFRHELEIFRKHL